MLIYSLTDLVQQFEILCYHGTKGYSRINFWDIVKLSALENALFGAKFSTISLI